MWTHRVAACLCAWLLSVGMAHAQPWAPSKAYTLSEWSVLSAHALDAATTQRCLGSGRCQELNPWLARYDSPVLFTGAKFGLVFGQLWVTRKLARDGHPTLAHAVNWLLTGAFTTLAIHNERVGSSF